MKYFVLFLLVISFVSAVEVDLDCPDDIYVDEEFECSLEVSDGDGEYDVKVDLDGERNSALEIWDESEDKWKSGYYYLIEFIESGDEEDVRLKISERGEYEGFLKLRQGDKREFFDIELEVLEKDSDEEVEEKNIEESSDSVGTGNVVALERENEVILLNSAQVEEDVMELVYVSKNAKIADYLIYAFVLFLIFVIGILVWGRF